jgi:hypothetical protein
MIVAAGEEGDGGGGFVDTEEPRAEAEEGAGGGRGARAALANPPDGGGIVTSVEHCVEGRHLRKGEPELRDVSGQFKVVNRQIPGWVGGGDETSGNGAGPRVPPQERLPVGTAKDASHTTAGGVVRTGPLGECGDDLMDVGRAVG